MVTYYRRAGPYRIQVLGRYVRRWAVEGLEYEPWAGDYEALLAELYLGPGAAAILKPGGVV